MADELTEKVRKLIASTKRIPVEQVTETSTFEQLALDSLDAINLIFEVEGEFNISVPDDVANSIKSVPQMVAALRKLTEGTSSSASAPAE
jgi:acyl carrier protein